MIKSQPNRRAFLVGTTSAICICVATRSNLFGAELPHREAVPTNSNVVLNFGAGSANLFTGAFLNIAKCLSFGSAQSGWPALFSGPNNYPNGNFISVAGSLIFLDPAYYGRYLLSWEGSGSLAGIGPNPTIVYSGGRAVPGLTGFTSGTTLGNMVVTGTGVEVEFAYGVLISSVSMTSGSDHGGAGLVKFSTALGHAGGISDGMTVKLNNGITGLPAGPNSDGSWSIFAIDASHFSLEGSSAFAGLVTVTARGGPGRQTEAIYSLATDNVKLTGRYSGFKKLAWYKKDDRSDFESGKLVPQAMVDAMRGTRAAYLRFMDLIAVQYIQTPSHENRVRTENFSYGLYNIPSGYWAGVMTNSGDTFTCPMNPSSSPPNGDFTDGEMIIAQVSPRGHNTTQNPKLSIFGRSGAAPIYTAACGQMNLTLGGTVPPTGTTLRMVFTGGGLSRPFTYTYLTSQTVNGPAGVPDTTLQNIMFNIRADLQRNSRGNGAALLSVGIWCQNPSFPDGSSHASFYYNPNINSSGVAELGAAMTISGEDPTANLTFTFGMMPVGYMSDNCPCTFTFSKLLGGWVCSPGTNLGGSTFQGGCNGGPPLEYLTELCARCDAGMWYNIGVLATASTIYSTVRSVAQATYNGKPAVKSLALEFGNEIWNYLLSLAGPCNAQAACVGISINKGGGGMSLHALRTIQMAQQAGQAWSDAGRARSELKIVSAYQFVDMSAGGFTYTKTFQFNGQDLNASPSGTNVTLKAFGGLGATAITTDYSAAPNRPIDWCDWASPATYWAGGQFNASGGNLDTSRSLSDYNRALLAAYNYAYGSHDQQQAALDFLYDISATTGDLYNGATTPNLDFQTVARWAVGSKSSAGGYYGIGIVAASYDSSRNSRGTAGGAQRKLGVACYEGGWYMGPFYPTQFLASLNALGYKEGYSSSLPGAATGPRGSEDTAITASRNMYNLLVAWKNDARSKTLTSLQFNQFKAAVNVVSARDALTSWYGFEGPSNYALYLGATTQSAPFKAYDALGDFI